MYFHWGWSETLSPLFPLQNFQRSYKISTGVRTHAEQIPKSVLHSEQITCLANALFSSKAYQQYFLNCPCAALKFRIIIFKSEWVLPIKGYLLNTQFQFTNDLSTGKRCRYTGSCPNTENIISDVNLKSSIYDLYLKFQKTVCQRFHVSEKLLKINPNETFYIRHSNVLIRRVFKYFLRNRTGVAVKLPCTEIS